MSGAACRKPVCTECRPSRFFLPSPATRHFATATCVSAIGHNPIPSALICLWAVSAALRLWLKYAFVSALWFCSVYSDSNSGVGLRLLLLSRVCEPEQSGDRSLTRPTDTAAQRRWVAAATKRALAKTDDCQLHTEHCQLRLRRNRSPLGVINRDMLYKDLQSRWARFRGKEDPNATIELKHDKRLGA